MGPREAPDAFPLFFPVVPLSCERPAEVAAGRRAPGMCCLTSFNAPNGPPPPPSPLGHPTSHPTPGALNPTCVPQLSYAAADAVGVYAPALSHPPCASVSLSLRVFLPAPCNRCLSSPVCASSSAFRSRFRSRFDTICCSRPFREHDATRISVERRALPLACGTAAAGQLSRQLPGASAIRLQLVCCCPEELQPMALCMPGWPRVRVHFHLLPPQPAPYPSPVGVVLLQCSALARSSWEGPQHPTQAADASMEVNPLNCTLCDSCAAPCSWGHTGFPQLGWPLAAVLPRRRCESTQLFPRNYSQQVHTAFITAGPQASPHSESTKFFTMRMPLSVMMDSGWNCTVVGSRASWRVGHEAARHRGKAGAAAVVGDDGLWVELRQGRPEGRAARAEDKLTRTGLHGHALVVGPGWDCGADR